LIADTEDWYGIDVCRNCPLNVFMRNFIHDNGDLDIVLFDENLNELASSAGVTDTEEINYRNQTAGVQRVYVQVIGVFGDQNHYDLRIRVDDRIEENDDPAGAELLSPNLYGNLMIISGDDDWYKVQVCNGGVLTVTTSFIDANGDIDVHLYASGNYTNRVAGSVSTADVETFTYTATSAGLYYIKIFGYNGAQNNYDLTIRLTGCP
jgi:hypothetical protein